MWRSFGSTCTLLALLLLMSGWRWPGVQPSARYYIALGDSLAAGSNAPTGQGYVNDLYRYEMDRLPGLRLENYGCPGATTTSMLQRGTCNPSISQVGEAVRFARHHRRAVAFITLDIGANDGSHCIVQGVLNTSCASSVEATVRANLSRIFGDLHAATPGVPIIAMTYYDPYLASWVQGDHAAARSSVKAVTHFDKALFSLFRGNGATVADVEGAFHTHDFARTGWYRRVRVPQNVANICHWTSMCSSGNVHAKPAGYQVISKAFQPLVNKAVSAGGP